MKVFVFLCFVAAVYGQVHVLHPNGVSSNVRNQDILGNYNFAYNEGHPSGATFRKESGDIAGNKIGSYGLSDADGRRRVVNYVADGAGFRASVHTNEPGVDPSKDPAAVAVNKGLLAAPAAALHHYGGLHGAYYGGLQGAYYGGLQGAYYGGLQGAYYGGLHAGLYAGHHW